MFLDCFLAAKSCSNAILSVDSEYGKSPCFLRCAVWESVDVDGSGSVFSLLDVGGFRV